MSDYRRLISYIYEYEGKEKGKNVGFVKLEARNGQCRLNLSVKKVYVGGNAIGVYLLGKNGAEIFLGNIFIRNGCGEFRATVDAENVENSGNGLDTYYGLTVHDVKNPWRSYTTIWEDAVTPEANGAPALPGLPAGDAVKTPPAQEILPGSRDLRPVPAVSSVVREIEAEIAREEERRSQEDLSLAHVAEVGAEAALPGEAAGMQTEQEADTSSGIPETEVMAEQPPEQEASAALGETEQAGRPLESAAGAGIGTQPFPAAAGAAAAPPAPAPQEEIPMRSPELENPEVLQYLQDTEDVTADPEKLWQELRKSYPKIQPFDYEGGCEILTIRPQDIGRLPRESWIYGNNSFLLHGYYNFRYIILFRLGSKDGRPRYLIGVPGHYYSSEKYMASMFGFPNFVLSKKQPPNDGRFGYWYTDIRVR